MESNNTLDMLKQSLFMAEENEESNLALMRHVCELIVSLSSLMSEVIDLNESLKDSSSTLRYLNAE